MRLDPPISSCAIALLLAWLSPGAATAASIPMRNLQLMSAVNDYPQPTGTYGYSSCWAYVHRDGREYAVIGCQNGVAIYNVTDPANVHRVSWIPGPSSNWREMKGYRDWLYIVTEGSGTGQGLQVVSMADPEHPQLTRTLTQPFVRVHTITVDTTRALLMCNGTRNTVGTASGMQILSLEDPGNPLPIAWWPGGSLPAPDSLYVHDCEVAGNRLYTSFIRAGFERVFDFGDPTGPIQLAKFPSPGGVTHSAWPDTSGRFLYVTDESDGQPLHVFDISNLASPRLVNNVTSNIRGIIHNPRVRGAELYLSNYTEGVRVLDIADPAHPAEFAWARTWPGPSGGFQGVWEVCPYLPSGTVIASDMESGLFLFRPMRNYGVLRVQVVNGFTLAPIESVTVHLTTQGDSLLTPVDGIVQFAPGPGVHRVSASLFGYSDASATRQVIVGVRDTLTLALMPKPLRTFTGKVRSAVGGVALEGAEIDFVGTPLAAFTDSTGAFSMPGVPDGAYNVEAHRPGFVPLAATRDVNAFAHDQSFLLRPAPIWDALEVESGWTVGALYDNAASGIWIRVVPLGTYWEPRSTARATRAPADEYSRGVVPLHDSGESDGAIPGPVQPGVDRTPKPGTMCFVTGQGTDPNNIGENDVDGGRTSLTSPAWNLTAMQDPMLGYWRWFYTSTPYQGEDWLMVEISNDNGVHWVAVDTTRGLHNRWEEHAVRVRDFVAPSAAVKLRLVAADIAPASIVEAAVDDVIAYDAALPTTETSAPALPLMLAFRAPWPDPAPGAVRLELALPASGAVEVEVLDLAGRRVRGLHSGAVTAGTLALEWDGRDASGELAPAGLYFARARTATGAATTRFVRVR